LPENGYLTPSEAVSYLLKRELLHPEHIVAGDLTVADISRRHHNYKVAVGRASGYVLKQGIGKEKAPAVAREAAMYQVLESNGTGLRRYLPRFYGYDAEANILILELVEGAQNLREYHVQQGHASILLARALGNALGTLHRTVERDKKDEKLAADPPAWILSVHRPTSKFFHECSGANLQLIRIVQQFSEFGEHLDGLRAGWQTEALIHRDIKWDNCMVFGKSPSARKTRLCMIDWELAGVGDPCWDVGSVFNDYLSFWLLSIPVTGEMPPDRFLELARFPLEKMQPALLSFWESYVKKRGLDSAAADRSLLRSVRYGAARLVQTAFEQMQMSMQLTGNIVCFLQLSLNMLQRPEEAAGRLLGLPIRGMRLP